MIALAVAMCAVGGCAPGDGDVAGSGDGSPSASATGALSADASPGASPGSSAPPRADGPLGPLFLAPGQAVEAARALPPDADPLLRRATERIAAQPIAVWLTDPAQDPTAQVDRVVTAASAVNRLPTFVVYGIPERDCGSYSSGGARTSARYRAWVTLIAAAIGDRRALVILEPDAVPDQVEGCLKQPVANRQADLRAAVDILMDNHNTRVYLDAGNARWIEPAPLAAALIDSGIGSATGFALNVSNYVPTADTIAFGRRLGSLLPRKHFVIDVSRNGRDADPTGDKWCNNLDARLGQTPTTSTGDDLVDALLWVKAPGESDGECNGGPAAGVWWPQQAIQLAS